MPRFPFYNELLNDSVSQIYVNYTYILIVVCIADQWFAI